MMSRMSIMSRMLAGQELHLDCGPKQADLASSEAAAQQAVPAS